MGQDKGHKHPERHGVALSIAHVEFLGFANQLI